MNKYIRKTLNKIGANPYLFDFLQKVCNFGDLKECVASWLKAEPNNSILDVGCGTGLYSVLVKGRYVGIDLNGSYIRYAQRRYKDKNKTFIVGDVKNLDLEGGIFDKTLYLAMLHHFNEEDNIKILEKISSLTREKILILDLTLPDKPSVMQKFFLNVERGNYIRSFEDQLSIVGKVFYVARKETFFNRSKFGLFSIIEAFPKNKQAGS